MSVDRDADVSGMLAPERIAVGILGPIIVAWDVQIFLTGIAVCIAYHYVARGAFKKDPKATKVLSVTVFVVNLVVAACAFESTLAWGTTQKRTTLELWRFSSIECLQPALIGLTGFLVQGWFCRRTAMLFKKTKIRYGYMVVVGLLMVAGFAGAICNTVAQYVALHDINDPAGSLYAASQTVWLIASACVDVINSATLCYLLKKRVVGFSEKTDTMLRSLIKLTIETGSYTTIVALIGAALDFTIDLNSYYLAGIPIVFWL
ncbi:hypothetical protein MNV49_001324 [Pseudohyphozyma bogoriensis]|nr:hypothetical protein MNV49_001324 [Pseudohyphozyma bogoriensis]